MVADHDHHTTSLARREPKKWWVPSSNKLSLHIPAASAGKLLLSAMSMKSEDSFCVEIFWVCFGPRYVIVKFSIIVICKINILDSVNIA